MTQYTLVVGDWSGDGHEKTEKFIADINLTYKEICACITKGQQLLGMVPNSEAKSFSDTEELNICLEYDENTIHNPLLDKLKKELGFNPSTILDSEGPSITACMDVESFIELWTLVLKHGAKALGLNVEINLHPVLENSVLNIGGYGLYPYT
jgi:hypothetical protein